MSNRAMLTLVLITDQPARLALPAIQERFANAFCETGSVLIPLPERVSPETALAFCREHRIGILASCVVARTFPAPTASEP